VKQVFKRKAAAVVAFRSGVEQDFRDVAEQAIAAGRYVIFGGVEEGTATLLLSAQPRLVAVVRKAADEPGRAASFDVLSVREAGPDIDREREELGQL
jgi:hypothetical protein